MQMQTEEERPSWRRTRPARLAIPVAVTVALLAIAIRIRPDLFGTIILGMGQFTGACALGYLADTILFAYFLPRLSMSMLQRGLLVDEDDIPSSVIAMRLACRVALVFVAAYCLRT